MMDDDQAPGRGLAALGEEVRELRRELQAARGEAEGWRVRVSTKLCVCVCVGGGEGV